MNYFLITGMARSGTTLLEKILVSHPDIDVLSQPLPLLYRHLKKKFYKIIDHPESYYVLGNLFDERRYSKEDFISFLSNYQLSPEELEKLHRQMRGWSGQKTSIEDSLGHLHELKKCTLSNYYKHLVDNYSLSRGEVQRGSKEIIIEEYIPYFIQNSVKALIIIRDPRDVVTSLYKGKGKKYAGEYRPVLFHLRNWRKSIAIANTFSAESGVLTIKYEDLIKLESSVLNEIVDFLSVDRYDFSGLRTKVLDRKGNEWNGNSSTHSFQGIDSNNTGKYDDYLSSQIIRYIEFICKHEMELMGYELKFQKFSNYDPATFKEEHNIENVHLNPKMSSSPKELLKEFRRKELLKAKKPSEREVYNYFYSLNNYKALKNTIGEITALAF